MKYTTQKLNIDELDNEIKIHLSLWSNPQLLKIFAARDSVQCFYLCCYRETQLVALMPIMEKKKMGITYITQLFEQSYTTIDFFNVDQSNLYSEQNEQIMILKSFSLYLKKYLKVSLKFDPTIIDIRPFKWDGFHIGVNYTYTCTIPEYREESLPRIAKEKLKKALKAHLIVQEHWDIDIVKNISEEMLLLKNRSLRQVHHKYLAFLENLYDAKLCHQIVVYKDTTPISFTIFLKDPKSIFLCAFVTGTTKLGYSIGANTLGTDYILKNFNQYHQYDFCGANIESIAFYKSQLNFELKNYYSISKKVFDIKIGI